MGDGKFANATTRRRQQTHLETETATEIAIGLHIESEHEAETLYICVSRACKNDEEHNS